MTFYSKGISTIGETYRFDERFESGNFDVHFYETEEKYHGVATDFDGVFSDHANPAVAERMVPLLVRESVGKNVPLAVITGKELSDAKREILAPILKIMPNLDKGQMMLYANNGSIIHDGGLNYTIDKKEFSGSALEKLADLRTVQILMEIYDRVNSLRSVVGRVLKETHYRQMDSSTICFRLDLTELLNPELPPEIGNLVRSITDTVYPTRLEIAMALRDEIEKVDELRGVQVQATDRSVDVTPKGTGKRAALLDFSKRVNLSPDQLLRFGDSPLGMDYGLLAAYGSEKRPGFSNVDIKTNEVEQVIMLSENRYSLPPRVIKFEGDQFEKVRRVFNSVQIEPALR